MGSNTSKQTNDAAVTVQKNDLDIGTNSDPRSPTPEIIRTPLQGKLSAKHNITKNADLRKTLENSNGEICDEKLIHNNPILSAVIRNHLQSYDPRSPTQDFERTPIIITSKINDLTNNALRQKKNNHGSPNLEKDEDRNYDSSAEAQESPDIIMPKNLCNDFCDLTLNESSKLSDEPLGSSTASREAIENNISDCTDEKPKTLLETNFDYIETKTKADKLEDSIESSFSTGDAVELDSLQQIPQFKILADDPRSPSAGIERTPIVVSKNPAVNDQAIKVEDMTDNTLIKVLQNTNADLRQNNKPTNEGVLIYEDEANNFQDTPKKSWCATGANGDARTPLSCMKNKADVGHLRSKSANDTNDKDKVPVKARRASHIPRLKALSKQTKINNIGSSVSLKNLSKKTIVSGDCENTPPHSHRDKWDKDSSIVL